MKQVLCHLLIAVALYSCTNSTADSNKAKAAEASFDVSVVRQSIEVANKKLAEASLKGDSATVVGLYHTDAKIYPPDMPAANKEIMGSMSASLPKMGIRTFTLTSTDVSGNADQVVETGTFEMGNGSKTVEKGKYLVVWKPENGEWKLWRDMWNSDNPPAPPAKNK